MVVSPDLYRELVERAFCTAGTQFLLAQIRNPIFKGAEYGAFYSTGDEAG